MVVFEERQVSLWISTNASQQYAAFRVFGLVSPVKEDGCPAAWNVRYLEQEVTAMRDAAERTLDEVVTRYVAQITGIRAGRDHQLCIFVSLSD